MSEMRRCKQCGILKTADAFRPYSYTKKEDSEATGRFRICRQCETLNSTYKRLCKNRDELFWDENCLHYSYHAGENEALYHKITDEIEKIEALYYVLDKRGYSVPSRIKPKELGSPVIKIPAAGSYADKLLEFYQASEPSDDKRPIVAASQQSIALDAEELDLPKDLSYWLSQSMEDFQAAGFTPDYLQETVYESLKAKYRPQTGTDPTTFLPIYDDTYKTVLNQILRLFDEYEDWYAGQGDETDGSTEEQTR